MRSSHWQAPIIARIHRGRLDGSHGGLIEGGKTCSPQLEPTCHRAKIDAMIAANKGCGGSMLRRASVTGSLSSASSSSAALGSSSKLRRSSSSLYLQGLAMESCGSPSLSPSSSISYSNSNSIEQLQQTFESLDLCGVSTLPTPAPVDEEGKKVVIRTLLVLVALKVVPGYLLELLQNAELQGVPLVLALGLLPTIMLKFNQGNGNEEKVPSTSVVSSWESPTSMLSLSELESHLQNSSSWYAQQSGASSESRDDVSDYDCRGTDAYYPDQEPSRSTSSGSLQHDADGGDEWGQFAYYEDTFREHDASLSSMARSSSQSSSSPRSSSLQTLVEMDDEDEDWDGDSCTF